MTAQQPWQGILDTDFGRKDAVRTLARKIATVPREDMRELRYEWELVLDAILHRLRENL